MPLPAPAALLTGERCRLQRPWGSSLLPPYQSSLLAEASPPPPGSCYSPTLCASCVRSRAAWLAAPDSTSPASSAWQSALRAGSRVRAAGGLGRGLSHSLGANPFKRPWRQQSTGQTAHAAGAAPQPAAPPALRKPTLEAPPSRLRAAGAKFASLPQAAICSCPALCQTGPYPGERRGWP